MADGPEDGPGAAHPPTARLSTGIGGPQLRRLVFGIITADYDAASEMQQLVNGIELGARLVALSDDSVLLFTKDRRKRSSRALPCRAAGAALCADRPSVTDAPSPSALTPRGWSK